MTLRGIFELRNQPVLIGATTAACMTAARDILAEDANTQNHANRIQWANRSPDANARQIMPAIAMNPQVQSDWETRTLQNVDEWGRFDDGAIQFIVNGNIDRFATGENP